MGGFERELILQLKNTTYGDYDAGTIDVTTSNQVVTPDSQLQQLLIYPTVECTVKIGDSTKEIFLPKDVWTPISVLCAKFTIKGSASGKVYWQGWVV
jgi:hypothetical protein